MLVALPLGLQFEPFQNRQPFSCVTRGKCHKKGLTQTTDLRHIIVHVLDECPSQEFRCRGWDAWIVRAALQVEERLLQVVVDPL